MIVIDGNGLAARSYFGTHYRLDYFDEAIFISAFIRALNNVILRFWETEKTILFCLDSKSWRYKEFAEYKSGRTQKDDNYYKYLDTYMDLVATMRDNLPITFVKKRGYEADDLLAHFARKFRNVVVVGNDKDFRQLTAHGNTQYYNFSKEQFENVPDPALDLHTLICTGDSADGIPSIVPRNEQNKVKFMFGEKTIPKHYDPAERSNISARFLETQLSKKKVEEKDIEALHAAYKRNKLLIDLDLSPVHELEIPLQQINYNRDYLAQLLNDYLKPQEASDVFQKMDMVFSSF